MADFDLIVRGGEIIDGTGTDSFSADLAVRDGKIAAVGPRLIGSAHEEIDARGLLVTPGFVDIHTHYDGQASWENSMRPSSQHGVTTVVMGNCGVGFAPCRPEHRADLVELMEGIEDIPGIVVSEGLSWAWESFPDYLDHLASRVFDVDIAAYLPHAPLRVYVMGARALAREPATADDLAHMQRLTREAIAAGALGFSTTRSINHRTVAGELAPSMDAAEQELHAIAAVFGKARTGVLQAIVDFPTPESVPEGIGLLRRLAERSGRPLSFTLAQFYDNPRAWSGLLDELDSLRARGIRIAGQVFPRPIGMIMGLSTSRNPLLPSATYRAIHGQQLPEMLDQLRRADVRAKILAELVNVAPVKHRWFEFIYTIGEVVDYEPNVENSIHAQAVRAGCLPDEMVYDYLTEGDGSNLLWVASANYHDGSLDCVRRMLASDSTVVGLGDGGAHYGLICDASYTTFLLSYWARDREKGPKLPLPFVVQSITQESAAAVGLLDRGILAAGYRADLNVIDLSGLRLGKPRIHNDLPAGGRRFGQAAEGYIATVVGGVITYRNGSPTGALPGRLVRGSQQVPSRDCFRSHSIW